MIATADSETIGEKPQKNKVVAIRADLHAALKAKAKREGRILQAMVEEKLEELVAPEQLTLEAVK